MLKYIKKISLLWVITSLFLGSINVADVLAQDKKSVPTDITANAMRYSDASQTVVFEGNVHVKRPDFDLKANNITVYFAKKNKDTNSENKDADQGLNMQMQSGELERIVASGNVKITKDDKVGTCNQGTYNAKTGIITMEGSPVIVDGKSNSIAGEIIKFYINENRSDVVGRVKATFTSPAKEKVTTNKK